MNKVEQFKLIGEISIFKKFPDGRLELVFQKENLITKASKQYILSGIYAQGIVSDPIIALKVGIGGNIDPAGLYPKTELATQTGLYDPIFEIPTVNTPDLDNLAVVFLADVDQGQCNGQLLTEVGMFKASGAMFNVKNHPGIPKTSDFSVHYEWKIKLL